jgi:hypothetical protein
MATDKHPTLGNHATVEAFSLWSVPVMTSLGSVLFCGLFTGYITKGTSQPV